MEAGKDLVDGGDTPSGSVRVAAPADFLDFFNIAWVAEFLGRHPQVRLKIGDKVYDRTLSVVDDPAQKEAVLKAKGKKYPNWKVPKVSASTVFRVNPA